MEFQYQQHRHLRRSSSRSPSLTRRPSLKEKSSGITKSKKKGSGSKKERWLLTRKTWRYMQDAVGSLLPEHKDKTRSSSPTTAPSTSRRASSSFSSSQIPATKSGYSFSCGIVPAGHSYTTTTASVPASHGYGSVVTHSHHAYHQPGPCEAPRPLLQKRASATHATISSGIATPSVHEADIPGSEQNFENICQREKSFLLWTRTKMKGVAGPALRDFKDKELERRTSTSSSIAGPSETSEIPQPIAFDTSRTKRNEVPLEYYSPEDEDDLLDDYDEYELDEEQMTVREFPPRKGSSGASSSVSIISAGHPFWRPLSSSEQRQALSPPLPSSDNFTVVTLGTGIQKYYRTVGIQTEPFSEEMLIHLRLESVREEQLQREEAEELKKGKDEGGRIEPTAEAEGHDLKGSFDSSGIIEDKKSEESGYSSSISDTVMRYLRMVRKNSKSDTKDAIDKFKTVNYDKSLRYIKSKNVTVEEALEHEKNKGLAKEQKGSTVLTEGLETEPKSSETLKKVSQAGKRTTTPHNISKGHGSTGSSKSKKSELSFPSGRLEYADQSFAVPSSPSFSPESLSPEGIPSPPNSPPPTDFVSQPSIGIQAGESLVCFLKNFNPMRSDMSSSYGSTDSPGEAMSARCSIATCSDMSDPYTQSVADDSSSHWSKSQYYDAHLGHSRHGLPSDFKELHFTPKSQAPYATSPTSFYATEKLEKSSSAFIMRSKGSGPPSPFSYPKTHAEIGFKGSLSVSTPTTPTVSPKPVHSDLMGKSTSYVPSYSSGPAQFFSGLRRKGSSGREREVDKVGRSHGTSGGYWRSPSGSGSGGIAESISSFLSKRSSYGKVSSVGVKDESGSLGLSLRRAGSGKSESGEHSSTMTMPTPSSTVMQKSKSSSSVFGSGEKRGSTSSASGLTPIGNAPASSSSGGSRLMSKTRIFKSRSKSTGRSTPVCAWTPQGNGKWVAPNGQSVAATDTNALRLNEKELEVVQKLALTKVRALNPGLDVKIPKEPKPATAKPKRRPYVLKKKALSTGFFDSSSNKDDSGGVRSGAGTVFGISLPEVIKNDKKREEENLSVRFNSGISRFYAGLEDGSRTRQVENGGRNSLSSPHEPRLDKEKISGSSESLVEAKRGSTSGASALAGSALNLDQELNSQRPVDAAVPSIVLRCIDFLEQHGMHTVGLFRVSSNLMRVRQMREEIQAGKDVVFGEDCSVHDIAALLKEFLRDLPDPLLCSDLYQAFLQTQVFRANKKLQLEATQYLIQLLPISNRHTLARILQFFAKVASNSTDSICSTTGKVLPGNKMDSCNLATVIAPNLMPFLSPGGLKLDTASAQQARERRDSIDVIDFMITNHSELFRVSAELMDEVYHSMYESCPEVLESLLKFKAEDDPGLDDLDTCSVFGGSELGEPSDFDEMATPRRVQRREEILHKEAGKGGQLDQRGSKGDKGRTRRDPIRDSGAVSGDTEKQSGGESDTSSTRSSRWFRRGRQDSKTRTSSDSGTGSEKAKAKTTESLVWEPKRASSLDSVTLQDVRSATVILTENVEPKRSTSHHNLQVPDLSGRRQSPPDHGVITASLKIPVPLNLDESEIPFIEEEQLQGRLILSHEEDSGKSGKVRAQIAANSESGRGGTPSSHGTTPPSSPGRLSSTTSMTFSPPMSPDDAFQLETMTARFFISPNPLHTSHPNTSTVVTQTRLEQLPSKSTLTVLPVESKSLSLTTDTKTALALTPIEPPLPVQSQGSSSPNSSELLHSQAEGKATGKETKGANIAGLIKSKTADFEKIAKQAHQINPPGSTVAQNLRLRSQGNIQLKQEFLLRQQQSGLPSRRVSGPSKSGSASVLLTSTTTTADRHRPLTRRKESATGIEHPEESSHSNPAAHPITPPSRWKRSELIASQPSREVVSGRGGDKSQ